MIYVTPSGTAYPDRWKLAAHERYRRAMVTRFLSKSVTLPPIPYGPPPSSAAPAVVGRV